MTDEQAHELDLDLDDFARLRTNRAWTTHVLPAIERMRDEHRAAMRDLKLPAAERCEHITAWEDAQLMLELLDKTEPRLRARLGEFFVKKGGFLERPFARPPI